MMASFAPQFIVEDKLKVKVYECLIVFDRFV